MSKILKVFLIVILCSLTQLSLARADIVYLEDQGQRFSVSFPDRWHVGHNQKSDDMLVFHAPSADDHVTCRVRVNDDMRFRIYEGRHEPPIQKIAYSKDFWNEYLGTYEDYYLAQVTDGGGLGRGFASFASAVFTDPLTPGMNRRGIMFASWYGNKAYVVDCSAKATSYPKWHASFMDIIKSVDFVRSLYNHPDDGYRPFLKDQVLMINGGNDRDVTYY